MNFDIKYWVDKGHYSLMNPERILTDVGISIFDEHGCKIISSSVILDEDDYAYFRKKMAENPVDGFIEAADLFFEKIIYSTKEEEIREAVNYLKKHKKSLERAWYQSQIKDLEKRLEILKKKYMEVMI